MKKTWVMGLSVLTVLFMMAGIVAAVVWGRLNGMHEENVQVVRKPDIVAVPTPVGMQDETLVVVEDTPEDIGEDCAVEIDEKTAAELEQENIFETVAIDENVINILLVGQDTGLEWNTSTRSDSSYDDRHKQAVNIDLQREHKGVKPHRHEYMSHNKNDPGIPPTSAEMALIRRIMNEYGLQ